MFLAMFLSLKHVIKQNNFIERWYFTTFQSIMVEIRHMWN